MSKRFRAPALVERLQRRAGNNPIRPAAAADAAPSLHAKHGGAIASISYLPGALSVRLLFLLDCYAALPPLTAVMLNSLQ
jgi:hypothetical protein